MFADVLRRKLGNVAALSDQQVSQLEAHYQLLVKWNRSLNLTTVTDLEEAVERHYCESLFLAAHLPAGALRIADIGSGAGFPGFPVAVFRPDCSVTLVESHQRKAVFLKEASRGLPNVRVVAKRADALGDSTFDHVISRAVSYADLGKSIKNLGKAADLLTGVEGPPEEWVWVWIAIQMPWGKERYLRLGHATKPCFT